MPVDKPKPGESRDNYLQYCIPIEIKSGKSVEQATAICASIFDKEKMSKIKNTSEKVMARVAYDTKFRGINLQDDGLENACWDGYEAIGTKILDGREVPNCVPIKE